MKTVEQILPDLIGDMSADITQRAKGKTMEKYLFLGGLGDGLRESIPDGQSQVKRLYRYCLVDGKIKPMVEEIYRKELIAAEDKTFGIFIENKLSLSDAMEKLIDGYKGDDK